MTERQTDHYPPHLEFGSCPKHFLEQDSTPSELYHFVGKFYQKFLNGKNGIFRSGTHRGEAEYISVDQYHMPSDYWYFLTFKRGEKLVRRYYIFPDKCDSESTLHKEETLKTVGQHAFLIAANLRAAAILASQKESNALDT